MKYRTRKYVLEFVHANVDLRTYLRNVRALSLIVES